MIVRLEDLHKSFAHGFLMQRRHVLHGLSLELEAGDCYGLLGDNGAGKSTTLRILLGLSRADRGGGTLLGRPLGDRAARRALGYLPETPSFHEGLTGIEFLRLGGQLLGLGGADLERRARALLERVELAPAAGMRLRKMSKGMLQRLGLAQALLGDPELLVLDEPMSGLDPHGRKLVRDLILEQRARGCTLLFSTHILSDVELVCTRAGMLRDGRLVRELRVQDLGSLQARAVEVLASGLGEGAVRALSGLAHATVRNGASVLFTVSPGTPARELVQAVLAQGGDLQSVTPRRASLEEIVLEPSPAPVAAPAIATPPAGGPRITTHAGSL